jgi:hypothetical protein
MLMVFQEALAGLEPDSTDAPRQRLCKRGIFAQTRGAKCDGIEMGRSLCRGLM